MASPRKGGLLPLGVLLLMGAVTAVFFYGIYLKTSGPNAGDGHAQPGGTSPHPSRETSPTSPSELTARAGEEAVSRIYRDEPLPLEDPNRTERPVIPESGSKSGMTSPSTTPALPGRTAIGSPAGSSSGSSIAAGPDRDQNAGRGTATARDLHLLDPAQEPPFPSSSSVPGSTRDTAAPRTGTASLHADAAGNPRDLSAKSASAAGLPPSDVDHRGNPAEPVSVRGAGSTPSVVRLDDSRTAPRGSVPAASLQKARDHFSAKNYTAAARSWNEWAKKVPEGSYTIQIAAVRLDRAGPLGALGPGSDGMFVLPPGKLPNGLSPVCVGIYPSAEAARRALGAVSPLPGTSGRPMIKPISALRSG